MNNEDFVTYETAVKLKELGFDWPTCGYYHKGNCADEEVWYYTMNPAADHNHRTNPRVWSAPTLAQAQKWLREVHRISVEAQCNTARQWNILVCEIDNFGGFTWRKLNLPTYESALAAGINAALKLIEKNKS